MKLSRIPLLLTVLLAALAWLGASSADASGYDGPGYRRGCPGCNLRPSRIIRTSSLVRHVRVVPHTRIVPITRVANHNRLVLHEHTVNHRTLTVNRYRTLYRVTVLDRYNTFHRRSVRHRYSYATRNEFLPPQWTVRHVHMPGANVWCGCGGFARTYAGW